MESHPLAGTTGVLAAPMESGMTLNYHPESEIDYKLEAQQAETIGDTSICCLAIDQIAGVD